MLVSGHHFHRVCQQCILGLTKSQADQGFQSVFCLCGDELSLEALEPLLPVDLYRQLSTPRAPSRPVSINESFQLKTVKEMTRDERKRLLERFEMFFLQPDKVQEFQEVFEAGVRHECSSSLYLSWLPLKLDTMETEQEALDRERGEGRCKYEEKGEKEYPRAKWDVRGYIQTKMQKIISSFFINIL